jgi:uncharacterized protein YjiS (DUF1127 family)
MRKGEERRTRNALARHAEIMRELQAQGMSRDEASTEAFKRLGKR